MCERCDYIRHTTDALLGFTFINWDMKSIAQVSAYIHARVRFEALKDSEKSEKDFLDYFNRLCDVEFKELNFTNPVEPKQFDADFDFREMIKNGE
jgi:hypothetical protein